MQGIVYLVYKIEAYRKIEMRGRLRVLIYSIENSLAAFGALFIPSTKAIRERPCIFI